MPQNTRNDGGDPDREPDARSPVYEPESSEEIFSRLERRCRETPNDADAWLALGQLNASRSDLAAATTCISRAADLRPEWIQPKVLLGDCLLSAGRFEEAAQRYTECIARGAGAVVTANLATALKMLGQFDEAEKLYQEAIRRNPRAAEQHYNLGSLYQGAERYGEAMAQYQAALEIKPAYLPALYNLAVIKRDEGDIEDALRRFSSLVRSSRHEPRIRERAYGNYLLCLNYHDGTEPGALFREHVQWGKAYEGLAGFCKYRVRADVGKKLRVGYVSSDFREHSVAFFVKPLLEFHDRTQFEIWGYYNGVEEDEVTSRLRGYMDGWSVIAGRGDEEVAAEISDDDVDILVDLAGHTAGNRLGVLARKPAPVQVTYLGYPSTTGLEAVDYRLTDAWADPPGQAERWYSEQLLRLPNGFLCYSPPRDAPDVTGPPSLESGGVTFGSCNNLSKLSETAVRMWSEILHRMPDSRLLLKSRPLRDETVRRRVVERFECHGVPEDRLILRGWVDVWEQRFSTYAEVDVGLDTFPYNGTTTTCEALWMGVPVVALAGRMHAGRVGVSLLTQAGLTDLVANEGAYIERAVRLGLDEDQRARLRAGLRERVRASPLCDGRRLAREIEQAYRAMWESWCRAPRGGAGPPHRR